MATGLGFAPLVSLMDACPFFPPPCQTITQLPQFPSPSHLWQVKLARELVLCSQVPSHSNCQLLARQYIDSLHMRAKSFMETAAKEWCTTNSENKINVV